MRHRRTRTPHDAALDRVLLAAMVERHPLAPWSDDARAAALQVINARNTMLRYILTGQQVHTLNGEQS